jgi:hypothetical protein
MKKKLSLLLLSSILFFSNAQSSPLSAGGGSIQSVLNMQIGTVVTIKLQSGNELTGIVDSVNAQVVHLSKIAGKDILIQPLPLIASKPYLLRQKIICKWQ